MKVIQFPIARITFWFVLGILLAYYITPSPQIAFTLLAIVSVVFAITYFFIVKGKSLIFGLLTLLLSFMIGSCTWIVHDDTLKTKHYINQCPDETKQHTIEISLIEKLKSSAYKNRYVANVKSIDNKAAFGKILLNIDRKVNTNDLKIGSQMLVKSFIVKNKKPNNPAQFDYGKYLDSKSIPAQLYANANNIRIGFLEDKNMLYYAAKIRERILRNLRKNNFHDAELNIVMALILGQQQEISPEILHDYQFAGAVHVLSVSGLHIGFILLFINFLLTGLPKNKRGNLFRFAVVFISLWGFAIIAGLSPSVVRSVTMFTFVAAGMCLKRDTNIFHTLLVSILLILLFMPSFLFDVGFQLSYVSLFFILWLQPIFSKSWTPKNRIFKYFWDILTVSLAAQIGAFPLSIYYFHQFPGLFFLTNLVILPALGFIMAVGVFVIVMAVFNYVPKLPAITLEWSIRILNGTINKIASFGQLVIKDIPLNMYMLISLYALIIAFSLWFKKKTYNRTIFALTTTLIFQIVLIATQFQNQQQSEMIVFHSAKNSIITKRNGEKIDAFCNGELLAAISENKILKPYLIANFYHILKKEEIRNTIYFAHKKILIIDSTAIAPKNYNPNVLLLRQSPKINLTRLLQNYHPEIIIADGSNFKSYLKLWKATCRKEKIPFHATAEKGFYRLK
ncbi:MAG: ComEC/Rec2 family competence protein [Flavobacterium sp.]|nr:ComEC/Rec2 family competence protein [Flavobacterium sp.]